MRGSLVRWLSCRTDFSGRLPLAFALPKRLRRAVAGRFHRLTSTNNRSLPRLRRRPAGIRGSSGPFSDEQWSHATTSKDTIVRLEQPEHEQIRRALCCCAIVEAPRAKFGSFRQSPRVRARGAAPSAVVRNGFHPPREVPTGRDPVAFRIRGPGRELKKRCARRSGRRMIVRVGRSDLRR